MNKPLWQPSQQLKEDSLLKIFFANLLILNHQIILINFGNGQLKIQKYFGQSFGTTLKFWETKVQRL